MAHKVTIECEARFVDHLSDRSKKASESISDIGSAAENAKKKVDELGKKRIKPIFDADNNKFIKKIREAEERARGLGRTKTAITLHAIDKATTVIGKALNKAQSFGGSVWNAILRVKDSNAMSTIKSVTNAAKNIAGKTWEAIIKVKDFALTPLKAIWNALFNIKTLIGTIFAGVVAKKAVLDPINLADQYSGAKIGFSTLLGDKRGQEMMGEIDKFAKETPFKTSGVISNVQKMMAYGWDVERVIDDMKTIGDAAASTGRGDQGLESIVYALSEIRSKGKLSTQELNQLASAGIKAKQYLAQGLGYGTDDEGMAKLMKDLEKGAIGANQAIDLILQGMEEFDGMMDRTANETVEGLWSQLQDVFEINIVRKWGQGLQDGAKRGFGSIVDLLNESEDAISSFGDTMYELGKGISNWVADKLEKAVKTIKEIMNTAEFKNADIGGKIKILWNEVIAEPFSKWWNSEGRSMVAKIARDIGKGIGGAITGGICAILGLPVEDVIADGVTIGGSFMQGFLEGFDVSKIGDALLTFFKENPMIGTVIGVILGSKLIGGLFNFLGNAKSVFGGSDQGGVLLSDAMAGTMNVTAGVVNVYGGSGFNSGGFGTGGGSGGALILPGKGGAKGLLGKGGLLTGGSATGTKLLTAGSKVDDVADAASAAKKVYTYTNAAGDVVGTTSKIGQITGKVGSWFGKTFPKLSKGLTKAAPWLSFLDFGIDGVLGYTKAKGEGDSTGKAVGKGALKAITGDYEVDGVGSRIWSAVSNTLKGAGAGGTIGGPLGALIGGVGGLVTNVGAQIADSDLPGWAKMLLGSFSPAGALAGLGVELTKDGGIEKLKSFFTETIPNAFGDLTESVGGFFTETLPNAWNSLWESVGSFFTETIPSVWGTITESVGGFFTETLPDAWNSFWESVGTFFTETVPYAVGYATGKVYAFFTETVPAFFGNLWDSIATFFTETIPEWAEGIWNDHVYPFFTETIPQFFSSLWDSIATFFTETLPEWAETTWNDHIVPFFTEDIPAFFSNLWDSIATFFTETLPEWAETTWNNNIVPFFTESIPQFFSNLWDGIATFFAETIPNWVSSVWNNNIVPFFTETIPGFFSELWDGVCGFFEDAVDFIAESIWAPISSFFTETIPGWISDAIDSVTNFFSNIADNFMAGFEDGSGQGEGGRARGGIVGGKSSSMEAFARGGIVGGSTRFIRVNEESPEMIIPLSSQRRERAMKLWAKTGQLLGVPGFARGGRTTGENDEGIRFRGSETETEGTRSIVVNLGGINIELKIEATDKAGVAQAIKEQIAEIAESVAGIFADEFESIFENTPVRGEA